MKITTIVMATALAVSSSYAFAAGGGGAGGAGTGGASGTAVGASAGAGAGVTSPGATTAPGGVSSTTPRPELGQAAQQAQLPLRAQRLPLRA